MTTVALAVAGAVLLAAGALVPVVLRGRAPGARAAAARARSAHARLGYALATRSVDRDVHRRATERWTAAGAVLARARSAGDFALAERTADEGWAVLAGGGPQVRG